MPTRQSRQEKKAREEKEEKERQESWSQWNPQQDQSRGTPQTTTWGAFSSVDFGKELGKDMDRWMHDGKGQAGKGNWHTSNQEAAQSSQRRKWQYSPGRAKSEAHSYRKGGNDASARERTTSTSFRGVYTKQSGKTVRFERDASNWGKWQTGPSCDWDDWQQKQERKQERPIREEIIKKVRDGRG